MRTKKLFIVILCVALLALILASPFAVAVSVRADDGAQTIEEVIEDEEPSDGPLNIEGVADGFMAYLKERYGEDYQYYYNKIIENWGSVEAYLLSFGEKLPEEKRTDWENFVSWLNEYAAVWAVPLAVAIIITIALVGKKQFNAIVDRIVNSKLSPIVAELNKQSAATVSIMHAQKALLGSGERFADSVKELDESEKELKNG